MDEIYDRCCGLDVHKDSVTACVMIGWGNQKRKEIKTFSTYTKDIKALARWLESLEIRHVAVESTGIYWMPIFHVMEGKFEVILANPQRVKNVPGRKTDVKDSEWLCRLLKVGLVDKSFIPPKAIVRLRELTRYRQSVVRDLSKAKNRIIKTLECANVKLSSVFSDVFGRTAWRIICQLVDGETDLDRLTENIHRNVKSSRDQIKDALEGTLEEEDLFILRLKMKQVEDLERTIASVEMHIKRHLEPFSEEIDLLTTLPGVEVTAAASILAEIGADMNQFHGGPQLIAWSGLCPGNNESAGKKRSARLRKGNKHLKVTMTQVAWAISRTKQTYLGAKYRALAPRKGRKRAVIAIARKGLLICYHMLKERIPFYDIGVDYLNSLEPERKVSYHAKRLAELGYDVKITKKIA